jgi:branched-chain amino acid transport system ATP-binding protein
MTASALATGCRLLMLDEPLGGLSSGEMNEFLGVVRTINQERGITIIIIEHILDSLIEISNRLMVLHNGTVIYTGDPEGVRNAAQVIEVYLGSEEAA